jgi:hypothetical protein
MSGPSFPAVGAKKALESLTGIDHLESEEAEASRHALDDEELRQTEYESMGMHAPEHGPAPSMGLWGRLRAWVGGR